MPWYRERLPWRVQIGGVMLTPEQPGPAGAGWQLAGAWALTYGPLGECRYGELGLTADPGLLLDTQEVLIWEHPDTTRSPDFRGIAGVVRGNTDLTRGAYTLAIVGEGDLDASGLARYASYSRVGAGYGLEPEDEETTEAFHARILEPFGDGGWGVKGDGSRVVGRASGGEPVNQGDVFSLSSSGYQRREYVTETSASPGDRWKRLYDTRPTPHPYAPRVYAPAKADNLLIPNIERLATTSAQGWIDSGENLNPAYGPPSSTTGTLGVVTHGQAADVMLPAGTPLQEGVPAPLRLKVRGSVNLSGLVRGSARSKLAKDATYELKGLRFGLEVSGVSLMATVAPEAAGFKPLDPQHPRRLSGRLTWRVYLAAAESDAWENALSQEFTGEMVPALKVFPANSWFLPVGDWGEAFGSGTLLVPVDIPEDLISEVFESLNGGHYWLIVEAEFTVPTNAYVWQKTTLNEDGSTSVQYIVQNGPKYGSLTLVRPIMTVDELVSGIPAENYPDGWDAGSVGPPTSQFEVPGGLIPPAIASWNGQQVTEARVVREYGRYYTECQTGARQTQKLLHSEKKLKIARDNAEGKGGHW